MNKKLLVFSFSFVSLFLFLVNFAAADILIYVQPANQGIIRLNITPFQTAVEQRSFEIKNFNNFSITIGLQPADNIMDIVDIEKSFVLQPNESRRVYYTVRVSEPGTYDGKILISFVGPSGSAVTYESKLTVIANKTELNYEQFIVPAIALATIFILTLILKRKWKFTVEKKRLRK